MPTYRCPICGASHKEPAAHCRLCGQNMTPGAIPTSEVHTAQVRHEKKGIKGVGFIGAGVVLAIVIGALIFGLVHPTPQMEALKDKVQGTPDGWTTQVDDAGKFSVEMPAYRKRQTTPFAATDSGKLTGWTAEVADDTELIVGYGDATKTLAAVPTTPTTAPISNATTVLRIREVLVAKWLGSLGLSADVVKMTDTAIAGMPAVVVRTNMPKLSYKGKDAYGSAIFALNGKTLYVVQVVSIYKDAEQFRRLADTFQLTGTL